MILTDSYRSLVRDYTGVSVPTDDELDLLAEEVTHWQEVALRVLRRRVADLNTGSGISSVSVGGEIAVTFTRADIPTINRAIYRLEAQLTSLTGEEGGVAVSRIVRPDRHR